MTEKQNPLLKDEITESDLRIGVELPEGWKNWNTMSLDECADYLHKQYCFLSSGDAYCINRLVEFYQKNKS